MAPRDLSFSIEGDPSKGIAAFQALKREGQETAKALQAAMSAVSAMAGDLGAVAAAMRGLREGAVATSRSVRSMAGDLGSVGSKAREVSAALRSQASEVGKATSALSKQRTEVQKVEQAVAATARQTTVLRAGFAAAASQTGVLRAGLTASSVIMGRMLTQAALLANRLALGARAASLQMRSGFAGASQGLQGLGIGFRMSGIAIGNQLQNLGSGSLTDMLGGLVGATAAGAEMGVRLVASLTGTAVRLLGSAANAILVPIGSIVQGIGDVVGTVFSKAVGGTIALGLQAAGNFVSAITGLVGEAVSQVGNIFTGIVEAARGAFQGVINVASNVLGKLVDVAEMVADKVGGVLGTVGKTILGVGGTLAGFALHDFISTESGATKGITLLDTKLNQADKKALRAWLEDLHRQMPTISREEMGSTFQRVVATGFSGDLPGAKKATEAAARLQFGYSGGGSPEEAARVISKTLTVYKDELSKFGDPFQRVSDLLFQTVNAADLGLGDLVTHLGEVIGPAKALGMTFEDLLVLIAKMSRTAGTEQTFTGLRRLFLEPLKMTSAQAAILGQHGLSPITLSPDEEEAIRAKQQAIADKEAEIKSLSSQHEREPELAAQARRQERAEIRAKEAAIAAIRSPFLKKQAEQRFKEEQAARAQAEVAGGVGTPRADESDAIKAAKADLVSLKKELTDLNKGSGTVTNLKSFLDSLAKSGIGARELARVFPDIRALTAALTLSSQSPEMAQKIEDMIVKGSSGKVGAAVGEQSETLKVKLLQVWEGLKAPFHATLESLETPFKGFLDRMIDGLKNLTAWWSKAISHPGAGRLLEGIVGKVGSLFGGFSIKAPTQGQFWRVLTDGLDKVWSVAGKVITAFETLAKWLGNLIGGSSLLGRAWDGLRLAGSWIAETANQLANKKTTNLDKAWGGAKDFFDGLWDTTAKFFDDLWERAKRKWGEITAGIKSVLDGAGTVFSTIASSLKAVLPLLGVYALSPAFRAFGAAFRPPVPVGAPGSAAAPYFMPGGGGGAAGAAAAAAGAVGGAWGSQGLLRRIPWPQTPTYLPTNGGRMTLEGPSTTLDRQPWALGGMVGRPDLMGPENDRLYRGRGSFGLTPSESMAFLGRYPGGGTSQRFRPGIDDPYYASEGFADTRGGGAVPMSEADRLSRAESWSPMQRFRRGMGNIGGVLMRGARGLGRWASGPGGSAALALGGTVLGNTMEEGGMPLAGGILGGTATGAGIGSMVMPGWGTAIGAAIGAIAGLVSGFKSAQTAAEDLARSHGMLKLAAAADKVNSYFANTASLPISEQIARFASSAYPVHEDVFAANGKGAKGFVQGTTRSLLESGPSYQGIEDLRALHKFAPGDTDEVLKDLGKTFKEVIDTWAAEVEKADTASIRAADKTKKLNAELGEFQAAVTSVQSAVSKATEALDSDNPSSARVVDAQKAASVAFTELRAVFGRLSSAATSEVTPAMDEMADAIAKLGGESAAFIKHSRANDPFFEKGAAKYGQPASRAGDPFFNSSAAKPGTSEGLDVFLANEAAHAAAGTAATGAASAINSMKNASLGAASALSKVRGYGTTPSSNHIDYADLTPGEARQIRHQLSHEEHLKHLRANNRFDTNGNQIDPFTGLPTGNASGWQLGKNRGDNDFAPRSQGGFSSAGGGGQYNAYGPGMGRIWARDQGGDGQWHEASFFKAQPIGPGGAVPSPSSTPGVGPGGGIQMLANSAKSAADHTKDLPKAEQDAAKAMDNVANAAKAAVDIARSGIAVTTQKVSELHGGMLALQAEITGLRNQPTDVAAGATGA